MAREEKTVLKNPRGLCNPLLCIQEIRFYPPKGWKI
jgi:hypothetical protein